MMRIRGISIGLWWAALAGALGLMVQPIGTGIGRLVLAGALPTLWITALILIRRRKHCFHAVMICGLAPVVFLLLPGRRADVPRLRESYVNHLRNFEGTPYLWGGENSLGIDCSGLVRRALISANLETGIKGLNPGLVRHALFLTWFDCSAGALKNGYRGLTLPVGEEESINRADGTAMLPGEIAVTRNGVHVLAYLGGSEWIQASPGSGKVLIQSAPNGDSWFGTPVTVVQWSQLATDGVRN